MFVVSTTFSPPLPMFASSTSTFFRSRIQKVRSTPNDPRVKHRDHPTSISLQSTNVNSLNTINNILQIYYRRGVPTSRYLMSENTSRGPNQRLCLIDGLYPILSSPVLNRPREPLVLRGLVSVKCTGKPFVSRLVEDTQSRTLFLSTFSMTRTGTKGTSTLQIVNYVLTVL